MAGFTVSVAAGKSSTQLTGAPLAQGTTIYNSDGVNAVWISSSQSVSPGNGQLVGPLGTAQWSANGNAYACVDTGVVSSIALIISGDVSSVTNPVALAAATATILLEQGIPDVFSNPLIFSGLMDALHTTLGPYDISAYASLIIQVNSGNAVLKYDMHQEAAASYNPANSSITETLTNIDGLNFDATWCIPVNGASIKFTNVTGSNMTVAIYGSNRQVPNAFQFNNTMLPRKFLYVGNANAGVPVPLPVNDGNPLTSTSFNRMVAARCGVGAISGSIGYQYLDSSGVIRTNFVALSIAANTSINVSFAHPLAVCKWVGQSVTTGATSFTLDLTPESA